MGKWENKKINGGNEEHRDGGGEGEGQGEVILYQEMMVR